MTDTERTPRLNLTELEQMLADVRTIEQAILTDCAKTDRPVPAPAEVTLMAQCCWTYMTVRGLLEQFGQHQLEPTVARIIASKMAQQAPPSSGIVLPGNFRNPR